MSDAVLNRYTSDSWSLELTGQPSALSRWTNRPVVKNEHFRLSLLGFETGAAPISWLEGDRPLLEQLQQTVEAYVQQNLQHSTLNQNPGQIPSTGAEVGLEPLPSTSPQFETNGTAPGHNGRLRDEGSATIITDNPFGRPASPFSLERDGLGHQLQYQPPATQPRALKLTTVQLADLLEVLDRWQSESMALPPEEAEADGHAAGGNVVAGNFSQGLSAIPAWGRVAASAAIALGAAGGGIYLLMAQPGSQIASSDSAAESAESVESTDLDAFPAISTNPSGELPNGQVGGQFSAPFLKQRDPLNPEADLEIDPSKPPSALLPDGELPNVEETEEADIPSTDIAGLSDEDFADQFLSDQNAANETVAIAPDLSAVPLPSSSLPSAGSLPSVSSLPSAAPLPSDLGLPSSSIGTLPSTNSDLDLEAAIAKRQAEAAAAQSLPEPDPTSPVTSSATLNTFPTADVPTAFDNAEEELAAADADIAPPVAAAPPAPVASAEAARTSDETSSSSAETAPAPTAAQAVDAEVIPQPPSQDPVAIARPTASVEQVTQLQSAAVKDYFSARWTPPEDLDQPLQYQLILSGEGSIERMNPLSPAATEYADQTGIPDVGESFIDPSTGIQDSTVVLTLGADGSVDVSVENVTTE